MLSLVAAALRTLSSRTSWLSCSSNSAIPSDQATDQCACPVNILYQWTRRGAWQRVGSDGGVDRPLHGNWGAELHAEGRRGKKDGRRGGAVEQGEGEGDDHEEEERGDPSAGGRVRRLGAEDGDRGGGLHGKGRRPDLRSWRRFSSRGFDHTGGEEQEDGLNLHGMGRTP